MGMNLPEQLVILLLGSNLGDRLQHFEEARRSLSEKAAIVHISSVFESEAWGYKSTHTFLNQVVSMETNMEPSALLAFTQDLEARAGRKEQQGQGYSDRPLDVDLLFYGNRILNTVELVIPHPGIPSRKFTLLPLTEVLPGFIHPVFQVSMEQMLRECKDESKVWVYGA